MATVGQRAGATGLLERGAELDAIRAAIRAARSGRGRLVLLEGAPGAGKTALVQAARERAAQADLEVLVARGSPLEVEYPYGIVRQLLESQVAGRYAESLRGPAATAGPLLLSRQIADIPGEDRAFALQHALYWLVAALGERRPLLMAVDDAQWADAASVAFLRYLVARLEDVPVALVVASRPPVADAENASLVRLELDPAVDVLHLAPLSFAATRRVLEDQLGEPADAFVAACHSATGGNPFFLTELARALARDDVVPRAEHAREVAEVSPARIGRWVLNRLDGLGQDAARLARAVAVLGDGVDVPLASAFAGLDDTDGALAAAVLVRSSIFGDANPLRFVHPIVRAAIYQDIPEPGRAHEHGRAARLLAGDPGRLDAAATHHLRSATRGDDSVVELLMEAARRAEARGAPGSSAEFLSRAVAEPPAPDRRHAVLLALGNALIRSGATDDAEHVLRDALELARGDAERAAAAAALARALAFTGRPDEMETLIEEELTRTADRDGEIGLTLEATRLELRSRFDVEGTLERLRHLDDLAGTTRTERTLLVFLGCLRSLAGRRRDGLPLIRRGLGTGRLCDPGGVRVEAWASAVSAIVSAGELDEADRLVRQGLEDAGARGAVLEFGGAAWLAAVVAAVRGDLREAEAHARTGLAAMEDAPWRWGLEAQLAHVLTQSGRLDEADAVLAGCGSGPECEDFVALLTLSCRGQLRLAQGRSREGIAELEDALRLDDRLGWRSGGPLWARHRLVLALVGTDPDRALELAQAALDCARVHGVEAEIGVALWAQGVALGGEPGLTRVRDGAELLARSPLRLLYAEALADLGAGLRRAGRRRDAREHLREALDIAGACGAQPLVARIADELRTTGARPRTLVLRGADALTPMERRIASMATQGMSNPEIAQALFVTRKNVEMHLTRAYSKLGIHSRAELQAALGVPQS